MPKTVYECLFLFDANRYAREAGKVAETVTNVIESSGGEVLVSRLWREDRLAYPVKGHRKGAYWLTYFRMDSTGIKDFNRTCEINENILRHLVIKIDERLIEPLVAHARGERTPTDQPAETPDKPAAPAESGDSGASEETAPAGEKTAAVSS